MADHSLSDEENRRRADAMPVFELATRLEAAARQLGEETRTAYALAAGAGSPDAARALARLAVADGDDETAQLRLRQLEWDGLAPGEIVTVAEDRELVGAPLFDLNGVLCAGTGATGLRRHVLPVRAGGAPRHEGRDDAGDVAQDGRRPRRRARLGRGPAVVTGPRRDLPPTNEVGEWKPAEPDG